ncbi:TATA box-binding protein-associated factor RNA polymerase I subunit A [Pelodytes ibericus]
MAVGCPEDGGSMSSRHVSSRQHSKDMEEETGRKGQERQREEEGMHGGDNSTWDGAGLGERLGSTPVKGNGFGYPSDQMPRKSSEQAPGRLLRFQAKTPSRSRRVDSEMEEDSSESSEQTDVCDPENVTGIRLPQMMHLDQTFAHSNCNGCHKTSDLCLSLIHKAIYKNQWERAAGLMLNYFQTLEHPSTLRQRRAPEIIWRLGIEILLNHPKSSMDEVNIFNERMKNIGVTNYLKISLEHVFYLLTKGQTDNAMRILVLAESWRYGRISASQKNLLTLIQAYKAVLEYHAWLRKKAAVTEGDLDYASQSSATQDMSGFHRQATASFQEIIKLPGVWDPFVLSCVRLLESSGEEQEIENLLNDYAYNSKNPANPNAHVYLYEFLKRSRSSVEKRIKVLQILRTRVPSHKLMLTLSRLLGKSGSAENGKLALKVIFDVLDFSGWKEHVKAWHCLGKRLKKALIDGHKALVLQEWKSRKVWWPAYHFTKSHAKKECKHNKELAMKKGLVAGILQGEGCQYFSAVCALRGKDQNKSIQRTKKLVRKHSCVGPD